MAKADLKKVEAIDRQALGACLARARKGLGWTLKELADAIARVTGKAPDTAQLARWEAGTERPHFDALLAVEDLHGPLLIQLAGLRQQVEVVTEIRIRRTA